MYTCASMLLVVAGTSSENKPHHRFHQLVIRTCTARSCDHLHQARKILSSACPNNKLVGLQATATMTLELYISQVYSEMLGSIRSKLNALMQS